MSHPSMELMSLLWYRTRVPVQEIVYSVLRTQAEQI